MTETTNHLDALREASAATMLEAVEIIAKLADLPLCPRDLEATPPSEPSRLPWNTIVEVHSVFQVRGGATDERHATALFDVLKREGDLKPLTVWRCGQGVVLIDGHHRLHAYRRFQGRTRIAEGVPVVWFKGSLNDAIKAAAEANNEVKLPMNTKQCMEFGWRLVVMDRYSKKETAKMANISERSVANMRDVKKTLLASGMDLDDLPYRWWQASRDARQLDEGKDKLDYDEFAEEQAKKWADAMAKMFTTQLARSPVIAAKALEIYFGTKAAEVAKLLLIECSDPLGDRIEEDWLEDEPPF